MAVRRLELNSVCLSVLGISMPNAVLDVQIKAARDPKYVPNFRLAFDHFLLHPGGRGVLDSLEEQLKLSPQNMKASRETLYRFGNVSAASTW